jgi:hypothetical protein
MVFGVFGVLLVLGTGCTSTDDMGITTPVVAVDGKAYNPLDSCDYQFAGGPLTCSPPADVIFPILFTSTGHGTYEARYVPDNGFVRTGSFNGRTFHWTAVGSGGLTASGSWTFGSNFNSFSGSSTHTWTNPSQTGSCNTTGSIVPNTPAPPPPVAGCS